MVHKIIFIAVLLILAGTILSLTLFRNKVIAWFYINHMETDERMERLHIQKIVAILKIKLTEIKVNNSVLIIYYYGN